MHASIIIIIIIIVIIIIIIISCRPFGDVAHISHKAL